MQISVISMPSSCKESRADDALGSIKGNMGNVLACSGERSGQQAWRDPRVQKGTAVAMRSEGHCCGNACRRALLWQCVQKGTAVAMQQCKHG